MSTLRFALKIVVAVCLVLVAAIPTRPDRKPSRWVLALAVIVGAGVLVLG